MEKLAPNPILEFNPNQMEEVRQTFNYGDINRLNQDLNLFEDWIKKQQHFIVKEYDRGYLERYVINSKGSIERAKKLLDKICTLRGLMPEYLQGFDIENQFQNHNKIFNMCLLPKPTAQNYRIMLYKLRTPDASRFQHIDVSRYITTTFQYLNCYDYNAGIEFLVDTRDFTFSIITKFSPIVVANTMMIMSEGLGLRIRGIHFISGSTFLDTMVSIIKQGLSKKLTSRVHVHETYESLFEFIPKELLPKELGGDLGTVEQLAENTYNAYLSPAFIKHMNNMERAVTDESKRLSAEFNIEYSGMPGSFKVLTVD